MNQNNNFGLIDSYYVLIKEVLGAYSKVHIFGSRSRGDFRPNSDLDLCVFDDLNFDEYLKLLVQLDDLELPYKFDLVRFGSISSPELRDSILKEGVVFV